MRRYTKQAFCLDIASRDTFISWAGVRGVGYRSTKRVSSTQVVQQAVFGKHDNYWTRGFTYPDTRNTVESETSIRGTSNEECDLYPSNYHESTTAALNILYAEDLPFGFNLGVDPASTSLDFRLWFLQATTPSCR